MSGVVQEVGIGVSQFVKGQGVVLMPLQSEYDPRDYEHGERERFIEDGMMDSKGMLYRTSEPPTTSDTAIEQPFFPLPRHIFILSRRRSLYKAPHISQHSQRPTMLYCELLRFAPWTTS